MRIILAMMFVILWLTTGHCGAADDAPNATPVVAAGAWKNALADHPRLLGPVERLRKRAEADPSSWEKAAAVDDILACGIVNAVEGIDESQKERFIKRALREVERGPTDRHQDTWIAMTRVARTYDFFYESIPSEERAAMIEWLNAHLETYKIDENAFHNSTLSKILCYLRVAYATWGDNPRAEDFRDYALVGLWEGKVLPVIREFGAGGGFTECGWYTRHSLWHLVEALELARRFEGYDGFAMAEDFFYQRLAYEMLQPYPGTWLYGSERYACEGDGSLVYGGHNTYPRHMRNMLAQYFAGTELAGCIAAKSRPPSNSPSRVVDFLYLEDPGPARDITEFPLAHLASGIGKVYARGDWSDDASWLRFECGDYFVGHQHFEVGNFEIFRHEPLAAESGEYVDYLSNHSVNWLIRTIAHNCVLVYDADETWSNMRDGGRHEYANDGGQAKKWDWTADNLDEWTAKRETYERGDIIAYQNRPEYMFVAGDCTAAYSPAKLKSWIRQIVFLRPHTFVIFDRVVSTRPELPKTWLLHCHNEGDLGDAGFTVENGEGRLIVRTLLPEDASVETVHGYTYGGRTFSERESAQTPVAAKWRVEVKPGAPRAEDAFLHVLFTDEPQEVERIETDSGVGVAVGDTKVFFEGECGGRIETPDGVMALEREVVRGEWE